MAQFIRVWWRLGLCIILFWMVNNFVPAAFQGAASETGQNIYYYVTKVNGFLEILRIWHWFVS